MGTDAYIVLGVVILALILFVSERLSVDLVALIIMSVLVISGVITPEEGVAGFSNAATVTVAAMYVLSSAVFKTGVMNAVGPKLAKLIRYNSRLGILVLMIVAGFISAFINNTPVVAVFIPIVIKAAIDAKQSPSRLLMPLSYAAIFGGTCTLIGTSTNILVSGIAEKSGLEPFSMFMISPLGIIYMLIGVLFMTFIGVHLIPKREQNKDLSQRFGMRDYLTEIILLRGSPAVGKRILDSHFVQELEIEIIEIRREDGNFYLPPLDMVLLSGDVLKIRCDVSKIKALKDLIQVSVSPQIKIAEDDFQEHNTVLVELIVTPNSEFEGQTLEELDFKRRYRAVPLAIKHREEVVHENLNNTVLKVGDILLTEVKKHRLEEFQDHELGQENPFIILSLDEVPEYRRDKTFIVISVMAAIVLSAAFELVPIMVGSLLGCLVLILSRCIDTEDAYQAIEWKIIFLLAGSLALGVAMQKSGFARLIADFLVDNIGYLGPVAIVSGLYLITSLLTEIMSNNATAALLAPIAIATAQNLELSPTPFLIAITLGASASFMTPIGYQTNTMIYTAGNYKFTDFLRVGTWLNIMFWIIATLLIPLFFPFK